MAIFKSEDARELAALVEIQKKIERSEKREKVHRIIIGVLAVVAVTLAVTGHCPVEKLVKERRHRK